jgi:hypothetical protein
MKASEFFDGVMQIQVPWRDTSIGVPVFYQDARMLSAMFLAPLQGVRAQLPSKRLHPFRVTPWHSVVHISAFEYRACDIGPYNELGISIPVSLDRPSPVFTGLLRPVPAEPDTYILHLPVTTEIACTLGIESGAYPKFLADIEFKEEGDWVSCRLSEAGQHILTLTVRKGQPQPVPRSRMHPINARAGRLLRPTLIYAEREVSTSRNTGDAKLELGDHRISQELRDLHLGRMVGCQYTPSMQTILTPVLESFAV